MSCSSSRLVVLSAALVAALLAGCADYPWPLKFDPPAAVDAGEGHSFKPPAGALNDSVTQANIRRTICSATWSAAVRPSASFLVETKARLLREAGLPPSDAPRYDVDFLVPLSLGGHPRKPENLWLQPIAGAWNARTKDRLDSKLHHLVCSGEITLREARDAVRADWKLAARYYLSDRELLAPID